MGGNASDSTLVVGTYASAGTAVGLVSLMVICAASCHTEGRAGAKPYWLLKLLTVYNIAMTVFFSVQAFHLYGFLSAQEAFSGVAVETDAAVRTVRQWIWIHAGSTASHLVDVACMIARGGSERLSYVACFHVATIYGLWGLESTKPVLASHYKR